MSDKRQTQYHTSGHAKMTPMTSKTTEQAAEETDYRQNAVRYASDNMGNHPTVAWLNVRDAYEAGYESMQAILSEYKQKVEALTTALDNLTHSFENNVQGFERYPSYIWAKEALNPKQQ